MFRILSFKVNKIHKKTRKSESKNREEGIKGGRKTNFIIFTLTIDYWDLDIVYNIQFCSEGMAKNKGKTKHTEAYFSLL